MSIALNLLPINKVIQMCNINFNNIVSFSHDSLAWSSHEKQRNYVHYFHVPEPNDMIYER
jgi:hypothetical protein